MQADVKRFTFFIRGSLPDDLHIETRQPRCHFAFLHALDLMPLEWKRPIAAAANPGILDSLYRTPDMNEKSFRDQGRRRLDCLFTHAICRGLPPEIHLVYMGEKMLMLSVQGGMLMARAYSEAVKLQSMLMRNSLRMLVAATEWYVSALDPRPDLAIPARRNKFLYAWWWL